MQMIREVKTRFPGPDRSAPTLWPSLLMGACGAILAYANAAPYSTIAIGKLIARATKLPDWTGRTASAELLPW